MTVSDTSGFDADTLPPPLLMVLFQLCIRSRFRNCPAELTNGATGTWSVTNRLVGTTIRDEQKAEIPKTAVIALGC
jgi:hypothetical protein